MSRLDHVNITVTDLNQSIAWYEDLFGFRKVQEGRTMLGSKFAILSSADSAIAMSEYPESKRADQNEERDIHRIYHFGIRIEDADQWRQKVKSRGLKLYYGGEVEYPNSRSWYVHDPSGHEIEVSWAGGEPLKF